MSRYKRGDGGGFRGNSRTGGRIAAGSILATVATFVVRDLTRHDSAIRSLFSVAREKISTWRRPAHEVDITDDVDYEIVDND